MAKTKPGQRIVVHLDPRMALEAIILNQLERLPASRRQEWLRGLLVEGFRAECLVRRAVLEESERGSTTAFTQWRAAKSQASPTPQTEPPRLKNSLPQAKADGKPFAALSKVMG